MQQHRAILGQRPRLALALTLLLSAAPCLAPSVRAQWSQTTASGCLAVDGTSIFATNLSVVFLSSDNGANWTSTNSATPADTVIALAVSGTYLIAGTLSNGVFTSTNQGTSWKAANNGLPAGVRVHAFVQNGLNLFVGVGGGSSGSVFHSSALSITWTATITGLPQNTGVNALALSSSKLFAGTDGSGVYRSADNGASWTVASSGLTDSHIFALAVSGTNLFAGTEAGGVFLSGDNGTTWAAVNTGLAGPQLHIQSLAVVGSNLFAGTDSGIVISTDNGTTWRDASFGLTASAPMTSVTVNNLAGTNTELFAGGTFSSNVWRRAVAEMTAMPPAPVDTQTIPITTLGGVDSVTVKADSTIMSVHDVDLLNNSSLSLVISGAQLTTSNSHFSIRKFVHNLPDTVPTGSRFTIIVDFYGDGLGTVYEDTVILTLENAATSYYIYLKGNSFLTSTSGVAQNSQPAAADLRVYPNPFSQRSTIAFTSESGEAYVSVANVLGVEVARIFSGELGAGEHNFIWDASDITPGMYECIVRQGGQIQRIPVMRMR